MIAFVETECGMELGTSLGLWLRSKLGTTLVLTCKTELEQTGIIVATIVVIESIINRSQSRNWNQNCPVPPPIPLWLWKEKGIPFRRETEDEDKFVNNNDVCHK